jgi:hypothetical protein
MPSTCHLVSNTFLALTTAGKCQERTISLGNLGGSGFLKVGDEIFALGGLFDASEDHLGSLFKRKTMVIED